MEKKLENCFMLFFANLAIKLGNFSRTQVTPLVFFASSPKAEMVIKETAELPDVMPAELFAGLSTAEGDKRAGSVCDQGHTLHSSVKLWSTPTCSHSHSLPPLPTPHTPRVEMTMRSLKQGLLPVWNSPECNPLFWTSDTKNKARITNSRTREHQNMLVGVVKRVAKKQEGKESLCQRMCKVYRSSRADWTNMAREIPRIGRDSQNKQA